MTVVLQARAQSETQAAGGVRGAALEPLGVLARRLRPSLLKNRSGRLLALLLGDPPAVRARLGGVTLFLRPAGRTTSGPFWSGRFEEDVVDVLSALVTRGCTIMDIGANVGLIGLRLAATLRDAGGGGRVLLFEPVPANAAVLRRSIAANALESLVELKQLALYDRSGTMRMVVEGVGERTGNATLEPQVGGSSHRLRSSMIDVPLASLDDLVARGELEIARLDLIKVDAEGADVRCLAGAAATLARHLPVIYGEFHATLLAQHGDDVTAAASQLAPLGYSAFAFGGARRLEEVEATAGRGDLFFVPASRRSGFLAQVAATGREVVASGPA